MMREVLFSCNVKCCQFLNSGACLEVLAKAPAGLLDHFSH
jgi:hypothetical protein